MIQNITIQNFACIRSLSLDLHFAEGKAPNGYQSAPNLPFVAAGAGKTGRVCPVLALYGANASGKTSILQALHLLCLLEKNGWTPLCFRPYRLAEDDPAITETVIALSFWKARKLFRYEVRINKNGVAAESLTVNSRLLFATCQGKLAELSSELRQPDVKAKTLFDHRCVKAGTSVQLNCFLHEIAHSCPGISADINAADAFFQEELLYLDDSVPFASGINALAATYAGTEQARRSAALTEIAAWLHKLDVRIVGLHLIDQETSTDFRDFLSISAVPEPSSNFRLMTVHKDVNEQEVLFDLAEESKGTQRLVGLLGMLLSALRQGLPVLIDEMDDSLHSLIVIELVRLFKARRLNENGAQLIFTVHNTDLLASHLLGLSDVGIVGQYGFQGTTVTRLAQVPNLRNVDNFRRLYLRGDFGGIPSAYA